MMRKYPDTFELALTADDVERIFKKGKIASLIGMEGGHSIDNSLGALRMFHRLGARYMTLTHSRNIAVGGLRRPIRRRSTGSRRSAKQVVREMNWLGMLVDLSHVSPDTMADAIAAIRGAGHLLALVGARADRRPAQRARRHPRSCCRRTAAS